MIEKAAYTCTILPTLMWSILINKNIGEKVAIIMVLIMTAISTIGITLTAIMLNRKRRLVTTIMLIYNIIITFTMTGALIYSGAIKI